MIKLTRSGYTKEFRKNCLVASLKGYNRMVKAEEDGLGPVNWQRGTRPMRQKRRLGKLRAKGSWYKHPAGCTDNYGKTPTEGSQGKSVPASQFTRKSAARAVDSATVFLLPGQKTHGNIRPFCLYRWCPKANLPLHSALMRRREVQNGVSTL